MQLETSRASALDLSWQRAQTEHAIAILLGKTPAEFSLPVTKAMTATLPAIPQAVPSTLLERRPDIAYAERTVAAANAAVGVAIAGYYPDLTLSATGGFTSSALHNLLSLPNRVWSLGPSLSGTLLDFAGSLTATSLLGLSPQETYQQLLDLQARRMPFSVTTGKRQYNNMLIATLSVTTESESENVLFAELTLKEVILVQTKEVYVAEKSEMKMGVNTAEVRNTGTKTTKPAGGIALTSGGQ